MDEPCPDCGVRKNPARICPCTGYYEKLHRVARNLYSYDKHFCRWEDAPMKLQKKYVHMAHMSRVWWGLELD